MDTFSIGEIQILLYYPDDEDGFVWHHRVLLAKVGGGRWVALTPDKAFEIVSLLTHRHEVLDRHSRFPENKRDLCYGFDLDDLTKPELARLKRRAKIQAQLLDTEAAHPELEDEGWFVAEPSHDRFGLRLTDDEVNVAALMTSKGIAELNGIEVFVERVSSGELVEWKKKLSGEGEDLRTLGAHFDSQGRRFVPFRDGVRLLRNSPIPNFEIQGDRAAMEWVTAIVDNVGDISLYQSEWVRRSGVAEQSMVAHIHFLLCEVVRLAVCVDQLDISNLACFEMIIRRLITDEIAVARNCRFPDYGGLELLMSTSISKQGHAVPARFNEWVTARFKEQAAILKERRLWKEEAGSARPYGGGSDGGGGGDAAPGPGKKAKPDNPNKKPSKGDGKGDGK